MAMQVQVVFDAAEPAKLAEFWTLALGYVPQPPPEGFDTWEDFGRHSGMPKERFGDQAAVIDPEGKGPRIYIQRVPESKMAKNRVHIDIQIGAGVPPDEREQKVEEHVQRLIEVGAKVLYRLDEVTGRAVVMQDPEGNEFCVT